MEEKCQTKWPFSIDHCDLIIVLAVCVEWCVCVLCVFCACVCVWSMWIILPPKDDTPPCGRLVHLETAWKPHLKDLSPQYTGKLRPRDLILHWDLPKTYLWSIIFNLLNLLIFNLLSSKVSKDLSYVPKSKTIYHLWVKCIVVTVWLTWSKCFAPTVSTIAI